MRFVLVDRILRLEPGRAIDVVKNVSATEDVFDDHFPGCPIFPGSLVIGVFEQSVELLVGASDRYGTIARLSRVSRATFRHFVRPGDQLQVRCERIGGDATRFMVKASARVGGTLVADATLEFALESVTSSVESRERAARLEKLARELDETPLAMAALGSLSQVP
jgi:3-hydroxyacyl-[acyl-carrier-protein] dehydratase